MTDPNKTLIVTVLDRSGSMRSIKHDMEGGFSTFIDQQKAQPGECLVSLYQFDSIYEVVFENKPIAEVSGLVLEPRGRTALLDATGQTIVRVGAQLAILPEEKRPGAVIIQIITDGEENDSKEFSRETVKSMIDTQQKDYNWQFLYLGTQASTFKNAKDLGIAQVAQFTADQAGVKGMYDNVSEASTSYRRSVRSGNLNAKIDLGNNNKKST